MGVVHYLADKLQNLVAGLGTDRDKAAGAYYAPPTLTAEQALNAYRGAWLPRKIVDIPARDACRKWRNWQASAEQITAIEAEEKRLGLRQKVQEGLILARLCGGSAILIGTGDRDPSKPLNPETVQEGGLRYLTVLSRNELAVNGIDRDPASERYGEPVSYSIPGPSGMVEIHPSRLAVFCGAHIPDKRATSEQGWGDSVLVAIMEAIRHADATAANTASLVYEAKVDVVRVPNLMQGLSTDPQYEHLLLQRFGLAATGKGINGMLILDKEEEYEQKAASFATLPDIMDRFYQAVAGAADIPMTRLFGMSPGGMNATGESDERVYYDRVQAHQELEVGPALALLDEALIRSALGSRPEEVFYQWAPLRQKTEKEIADIGKTIADTVKALTDSSLFPEDVLAQAGSNALIEAGALPGLEAAIAEFGLEREEDDEADIAAAATMNGDPEQAHDPMGVKPDLKSGVSEE